MVELKFTFEFCQIIFFAISCFLTINLFYMTESYSSNFYTSKDFLGYILEGSPGFIFSCVYEFLQSHVRLVYFVICEIYIMEAALKG